MQQDHTYIFYLLSQGAWGRSGAPFEENLIKHTRRPKVAHKLHGILLQFIALHLSVPLFYYGLGRESREGSNAFRLASSLTPPLWYDSCEPAFNVFHCVGELVMMFR